LPVAAVSIFLEQWCFRERDGLSRQRPNTRAVSRPAIRLS